MLDANLSQSFVTDLPLLLKKAIDYLPSSPCQCLQDVCKTNKPNLTYVQGLLADKPNAALFANVLNLKLLHWSPSPFPSTPRLRLGVLGLGLGVLERSRPSTPPPAVVLILKLMFSSPPFCQLSVYHGHWHW